MVSGLETRFLLDERWHRITSGIERSKKPDLPLLARVLAEAKVAYAVIGGLALQVHQAEPRTTLDIDLAVRDREDLPRARLESAGGSAAALSLACRRSARRRMRSAASASPTQG